MCSRFDTIPQGDDRRTESVYQDRARHVMLSKTVSRAIIAASESTNSHWPNSQYSIQRWMLCTDDNYCRFYRYFRQWDYVFTQVSVCLSVCLSVNTITQKLLYEILWNGWTSSRDQSVRFWVTLTFGQGQQRSKGHNGILRITPSRPRESSDKNKNVACSIV